MEDVHYTCVAIARNKNGELLVGKSPKWSGKWVFPGGHIEKGETAELASEREIFEEMGIKARAYKVLGRGRLEKHADYEKPIIMEFTVVLLDAQGTKLKIDSHEFSEAGCYTLDEIKKLDLALPEEVHEVLDNLRAGKHG